MRYGPAVDRRSFLAGVVTLGATLLFANKASALRSLSLGDHEILVVSDGNLLLPIEMAYPDVPREELLPLLAASGMPTDRIAPDCNVTLVRSGDRTVLFDVGSGPHFMPTAGKLLDSLADASLTPEDVTDVVFTHGHPDHLWGLVDDFDELVFPQAAYHMNRAEWNFWRDDNTLAKMPEERKSFVIGAQNRMALIEDRISLFDFGGEPLSGIEAIDTSGHTPGHTSFAIHDGDQSVVIVGDAISNTAISFAHPEWPTATDQDTEKGIATRMALLERLAVDKSKIVGFHFPHPGAGRAERDGTAYRFVLGD